MPFTAFYSTNSKHCRREAFNQESWVCSAGLVTPRQVSRGIEITALQNLIKGKQYQLIEGLIFCPWALPSQSHMSFSCQIFLLGLGQLYVHVQWLSTERWCTIYKNKKSTASKIKALLLCPSNDFKLNSVLELLQYISSEKKPHANSLKPSVLLCRPNGVQACTLWDSVSSTSRVRDIDSLACIYSSWDF